MRYGIEYRKDENGNQMPVNQPLVPYSPCSRPDRTLKYVKGEKG